MNNEQEKQWREEFDINLFNGASFRRESSEASFIRDSEAYRLKMDGYLAGRKKAQEEIKDKDDLIIILKMKLNGLKEKVKELEEQLLKKDKLIKEIMGALESSNMEINDWHMEEDSHCNWNNMLIEKAKKLVGEK